MRRSMPLYFAAVALLAEAGALTASNVIPCRAKTWLQNARSPEKRVCRQMDAGSAHVAVLAIAPWEDYVSQMQADLSVSRDDALNLALPVTSTHEETVIQALTVALKAALPGAVSPKPKAEPNDESTPEGDAETPPAEENQEQASEPAALPQGQNGIQQAATNKKAKISDKPPAFDPVMRRLNALALYQEAKLLSLRIVDTAVPEKYTPYMVSLQITLMPNARREPYDAYTTVTFLPAESIQTSEAYVKSFDGDERYEVIRIVPLLVTDNMESTRRADLTQQIRDLSFAAAAMTGDAKLSAAVRKQFDRLVKSESTDFNSLMTVARLSDNSLRVRLGAVRGNNHYSVVPRTHNITLLVMVPERMVKARQELTYVARTQLVDAVHGTPLSVGSTGTFGWRYDNVAAEWIRDYELPDDIGYYYELLSLAQAADYTGFRRHLQNVVFSDAKCDSRCKLLDPTEHQYWDEQSKKHSALVSDRRMAGRLPKEPESFCKCEVRGIAFSESFRDDAIDRIWADVSSYNGTGQYSKGLFALPESSPATRRFFSRTSLTPVDDGRSTVVTVRGARFIAPERVRARLHVVTKESEYYLEATGIAEDGYGGAKITFPPVRKLVKGSEVSIDTASALMLSYAPSSYRWNTAAPFRETPGMGPSDITTLNDGGEVAYPVVSIIFADPPPEPPTVTQVVAKK